MPNAFNWSKVGGVPINEPIQSFDWDSVGGIPEKPAKHERSLGKETLRQVGRTGRAIATGIASIADVPNLASLGLHAAGLKEDPYFYEPIAPKLQKKIDELTEGKLKPESKAEEYVDAITEGVAPLALSPLTGGASLVGIGAKQLAKSAAPNMVKKAATKVAQAGTNPYALNASNVAQNIGASTAIKRYTDTTEDSGLLGALGAGLIGSAAGKGTLNAARLVKNPKNVSAEFIGKATGFSPEKYAQLESLEVPMTLGDVSKGMTPKYIEMVLAKTPGAIDTFEDVYKKKESALSKNLGLKKHEDLTASVSNIPKHMAKEGAGKYKERIGSIYEKYEEKFQPRVEAAISNKELVDVSDIYKMLEHETRGLTTSKEFKDFTKTPLGHFKKQIEEYSVALPGKQNLSQKEIEQLKKMNIPQDKLDQLTESGKKISYKGLDTLRDEALNLREKAEKGTPEYRDLSRIYNKLSEKRHQFMEVHGSPSERHAAKQARSIYKNYADEKETNLKQYVEKLLDTDSEVEAFNKLTSTDPKYLKVAMNGLKNKDDKRLLSESIIADLGTNQGRFNINTAYTHYANLEAPVKSELLKGFSGSEKKNFIDTMNYIGENKNSIQKLMNTSNTAHTTHVINYLTKAGKAGVALFATQQPGPAATIAAAYFAANGTAKLWTNQTFLKRMNDVIKAQTPKAQYGQLHKLLNTPIVKTTIRNVPIAENELKERK